MRRFVLAAVMVGAASGAWAADMPDLPILRGSLPAGLNTAKANWDGWYVGGQIDYYSAEIDFGHGTKTLTDFMLRNTVLQDPISQWSLFSKNHAQANGFGGFVGRNWQWEDLVFGLEANYNYLNSLGSASTNSMSLVIINPAGENPPAGHIHSYDTTLSGSAALQIKDVVTFRGRAGWVYDCFLPYVFGGLAVGRVDVSRSATVFYNKFDDYDVTTNNTTVHHTDFLGSNTFTQAERRANDFVAGWTGGLGLEYMVWNGLFVRAEWEYLKFLTVKNMVASTNSARLGIGYKF